jgi:hypothetical protein
MLEVINYILLSLMAIALVAALIHNLNKGK